MAARAPGAGELRERVHLQKRGAADDGFGGDAGGAFKTQVTVWARLMPLRGGEAVLQGRLQGQQTYVLTIRQSSETRQITSGWRIVDARNEARIFAITSPPIDPYVDHPRQFFDILIVEGRPS